MKILITIDSVQSLLIIPKGSRIQVEGTGSRISLYKKSSNKDIVVEDTIDALFNQLTESIKITSSGKTLVLVLTDFSKITANGSGSTVFFKDGVGLQKINATESVTTLNNQLNTGTTSAVTGSFTKITGTNTYTVTHSKNSLNVTSVEIIRDSDGRVQGFTKDITDANTITISGVTNVVPNGTTFSVNISFA